MNWLSPEMITWLHAVEGQLDARLAVALAALSLSAATFITSSSTALEVKLAQLYGSTRAGAPSEELIRLQNRTAASKKAIKAFYCFVVCLLLQITLGARANASAIQLPATFSIGDGVSIITDGDRKSVV